MPLGIHNAKISPGAFYELEAIFLKLPCKFLPILAASVKQSYALGHQMRVDAAYVAAERLPGFGTAGRALAFLLVGPEDALAPLKTEFALEFAGCCLVLL